MKRSLASPEERAGSSAPAPWRARAALLALALAAFATGSAGARPAVLPTGFVDEPVVGNLYFPVGMAFLPDGRLLVLERDGWMRLVVNGKLGAVDPSGSVDSVYSGFFEAGLLGAAVDPRWPDPPYVYLYYVATDSTIRIARFRMEGDIHSSEGVNLYLDLSSRYELFRDIRNENDLHNGGTIRFGSDGMLYVGLGDDDVRCAAQDTVSFRGVMLRLRVDGLPEGPGGPPDKSVIAPHDNPFASHPNPNARLVWTIGLRNPFRFHIDPVDGRIFVADVGWYQYEEIDLVDGPGLNFGWPYFEGPASRVSPCEPGPGRELRAAIYAYDRTDDELASFISADVYRGAPCATCNFPAEYEGDYFFSDYYMGFLRRLKLVDGEWRIAAPVPGQPSPENWAEGYELVSEFMMGPDGALWYVYNGHGGATGEVRRISYAPPPVASAPGTRRDDVAFSAPYPSPSRGEVRFVYALGREARVGLDLFDTSGRLVRRLAAPQTRGPGRHTQDWDGRTETGAPAAPGLYVARLLVDGVSFERRVPVIR